MCKINKKNSIMLNIISLAKHGFFSDPREYELFYLRQTGPLCSMKCEEKFELRARRSKCDWWGQGGFLGTV